MSDLKSIQSIVVATDFSPAADRALQHAAVIAHESGAKIRLLHVSAYFEGVPEGVGLFPETRAQAKAASAKRLEELADHLRAGGLVVETSCLDQPAPARTIVEEARSFGADLIAIGTRGLSAWRRMLLGSTARRVIEHAPCPVLILHEDDRPPAARHRAVLFATDFSPCARRALARGTEMFGLGAGDSVLLFHGIDVGVLAMSPQAPFNIVEYEERLCQEANQQLEAEAESLQAAGFRCRTEVYRGNPAQGLEARAREMDADLVVVGSVGRSLLSRLLLGATAERIATWSSCPVLIVPCSPASAADPGEHGVSA